jgi:DNA processing protein
VDDARDILEELGLATAAGKATPAAPALTAEATRLLDSIGFDPSDIDSLALRSGLTAERLYAILLQMELDGRIASLPGGRFQRIGP